MEEAEPAEEEDKGITLDVYLKQQGLASDAPKEEEAAKLNLEKIAKDTGMKVFTKTVFETPNAGAKKSNDLKALSKASANSITGSNKPDFHAHADKEGGYRGRGDGEFRGGRGSRGGRGGRGGRGSHQGGEGDRQPRGDGPRGGRGGASGPRGGGRGGQAPKEKFTEDDFPKL